MQNKRFFSNIISFAVEIYTDLRKAISLEGVTELLKKIFDVEVTYEAIRQWILASKKTISRREIVKATIWHADETYIKIKGKGYWLWIVYDKIATSANIFVDLWNLPEWYAQEFLKAMEQKWNIGMKQ